MRIQYQKLYHKFLEILLDRGFTEAKAEKAAANFADSSLDGFQSHGVNRFLEFIMMIEEGYIDIKAEPEKVEQNGNIEIYKWLSRIVLLFLITFPATIIKDFSHFYNHQEIFIWTITALTGSALIMFSWFILKALYNPEIFRGIDPEIKPVKALTNSKVDSKSIETDLDTKNIAIIEKSDIDCVISELEKYND